MYYGLGAEEKLLAELEAMSDPAKAAAMAQAQAAAAERAAEAQSITPMRNYLLIGGALLVVGVLVFARKGKR